MLNGQAEEDMFRSMLDALYSILNVEGAAKAGGKIGAYDGLDIGSHFEKVRTAIRLADPKGVFCT